MAKIYRHLAKKANLSDDGYLARSAHPYGQAGQRLSLKRQSNPMSIACHLIRYWRTSFRDALGQIYVEDPGNLSLDLAMKPKSSRKPPDNGAMVTIDHFSAVPSTVADRVLSVEPNVPLASPMPQPYRKPQP